MRNALLPGLGGPMGRFARPGGMWFRPLPWTLAVASVLFIVLTLRQLPCVQTSGAATVNSFIRLCYSDIPIAWTGQHFEQGASPLGSDPMVYPPLLGLVLLVVIKVVPIVAGWGPTPSPGAEAIVNAEVFFALTALVLFLCFLGLVVCTSLLGRGSRGTRAPTWDGMLIAASPVVLASGLISYDLLAVFLVAYGLLQFTRGRIAVAGIVFGLAAGAATLSLVAALAVALAIGLRGKVSQLGVFVGGTVGTVLAINLPLLLHSWPVLFNFYRLEITKPLGYGSLSFAAQLFGWQVREAGALGFLLACIVLSAIAAWAYVRRLRPRVGTLVAVFLFVVALFGPTYTPQTALWLLFALVLARPGRTELVAFTSTQILYWAAVWGYLAGHLKDGTAGNVYFLALLVRVAVEVWLIGACLADASRPSRDRVRTPDVPDPIGGVLNEGERLVRLG